MVRQSLVALALSLGFALAFASCARPPAAPALSDEPPPAPRQFRAAWVATVANIDWPSKNTLTVEEQRAEMRRIVERAAELRLNALVFQVRTSADALYPSKYEPWSEYLTGEQGKPPEPFYDPLKEWVDLAHRRGIELHAWFNPYRARHFEAKSPPSATHIATTHPDSVKSYGGYLWMDPGDAYAVNHTLDVVLDVVRRYDVDGVHIDDYFYPYPEKDTDFPDDPSWQAYVDGGGTLARADWRRQNVTNLIERMYDGVHREKSWVKSGISPFGLGRPDRRPPGITGFSQYDKLYADVELWLEKGWLDYLAPQIYWPRSQEHQPFGVLFDYWIHATPHGRHVWPGLFTSKIESTPQAKSWSPDEVVAQVDLTHERGAVHFSMKSLMENRQGIADRLKAGPYASDALVPASPWLDRTPPKPPRVVVDQVAPGQVKLHLSVLLDEPTKHYAVWSRHTGAWHFTAVPTSESALDVSGVGLDEIVVSVTDRAGNESERVHLFAKEGWRAR